MAVCVMLAGCAVDGGEAGLDVGVSALPIANPTTAGERDLLGVVVVHSPDHPDHQPEGSDCSGTLIASDTVLTAAHCFCTSNVLGDNDCAGDAVVTFRADPDLRGSIPTSLVGSATIHPDYDPSWWPDVQIEHDLAVVKLDGVAPAHVRPLVVAEDWPSEGSTVMVAGFGKTGHDCEGPHNLHTPNFAFATIDGYEDGLFDPPEIMRFADRPVCSGDSGGAVLDEAASRIFAVISSERVAARQNLAITTASEFEWIKSFMCPSSTWNECAGDGDVCSCTARTDILWRHANGQLAIWFEGQNQGPAFPSYHNSGQPVPLSFQVRGLGDFDADGHSDILWQGPDGRMAIWFMADGVMVDEAYPGGQVAPSWKVQGVADFDADGHSDILWRDDDGQLAIWFQGDYALARYPGYNNEPAPVPVDWQVQGLGDFDGDERSDIVWRNTASGQVAIWMMDGHWRVGEEAPGPEDPTLFSKIQAIGDFDGNLRSDILFRDGDGNLDIWFDGENEGFGGPSYNNLHGPVGDPDWKVVGVGDFDHDRRDDILWRHSGGLLAVWLLSGVRFVGDLYPGAPDNGWQIDGLVHESGL